MIYELMKNEAIYESIVKWITSVRFDVYAISQMSAICLCLLS